MQLSVLAQAKVQTQFPSAPSRLTPRMAFLIPFLLLLSIHGSLGAVIMVPRGHSQRGYHDDTKKYCVGWIANTDSNNIQGWTVTPPRCRDVIKNYMERGQYLEDFSIATDAAYTFLQTQEPTNGNDAMVFDIDETALSNLPYYRKVEYGGEVFNATSFNAYVDKGSTPVLKSTLELYKKLQAQNWVLIFITGRDESQYNITAKNLIAAGFTNWNELILRPPAFSGVSAAIYKAAQRVLLVQKGYIIKSCIGDQWSDCSGGNAGNRTFKLANPMYYIA